MNTQELWTAHMAARKARREYRVAHETRTGTLPDLNDAEWSALVEEEESTWQAFREATES